jgi:hypothetical protein
VSSEQLERHVLGRVTPVRGGPRGEAVLLGLTLAVLAWVLLWSATNADLPQFRDKATPIRLVCSPVAAAVVPACWWLAARRGHRRLPFPYVPALLVALPLVIDLAGNAAGLYVSVEDFDDAVHLVNPMLLVAAAALLLRSTGVPRWAVWVMAFGLGCAGNVVWELLEYVLMMGVGAVELRLSLRDTLSDQAWGLLGAAVGAAAPLLRRSRTPEQAVVGRPVPADDAAAHGALVPSA